MLTSVLSFLESVGRIVAVVLLVAVVVGSFWFAWLGRRSRRMTPRLSPPDGPLLADGPRPNWVSTMAPAGDVLHGLAPRACGTNPIARLADALEKDGCRIEQRAECYLHATHASLRFGFVDDIELLYEPQTGLLQARSASRVGYSDLGVNRKRLSALFQAAGL